MKDILEKAAAIKLVIFDVDGVLTDGSLFIGDDGQEYKAFNSQDGHGIKMLQKYGVRCAIITGRTSKVVEHRVRNLGIDPELVWQGQHDKLHGFAELLKQTGLQADEIADYLASEEWRGKAGGYAIQGRAGGFVTAVNGSYFNVVGLPLYETLTLLEGMGFKREGRQSSD